MRELDIPTKKKNILAKKGIITDVDLLNLLPRDYIDFRNEYTSVSLALNTKTGCFIGKPYSLNVKYSNNRSIITFKLELNDKRHINVCLIGQNFMKAILENMMGVENICVFGKLSYEEPYGFSILSPTHICYESSKYLYKKIKPIYTKFEGISEDWLAEEIKKALDSYEETPVNEALMVKHGLLLPSTKQSYENLHNPKSLDEIDISKKRIDFNTLFDFSMELQKQSLRESKGTAVNISSLSVTKNIVASLPYSLTDDQRKYLNEMIISIKDGKRVSALIQGDVGCGKTIVAILLLFAMAENGYQGVLMAPTSILAAQHFEQIEGFAKEYGINVAFLEGTTKTSEKNRIYKGVASGDIKILVGTHALTSDKLKFSNLGLVIIDEEHRFGVEQRNSLLSYSKSGVNTIVMSATPMPRTLAGAMHSSNTKIMDIHSMPKGRIPVVTGIADDENRIFNFIEKELLKGRQAYVVCPLIDDNESLPIKSVTDTEKAYRERFSAFKVDSINGKMSQVEINEKIQAFKNKEFDILVTTTIVEVGVNVPNASVIVISNAERFGLAQLHQLRGRVGRGSYKSCCILQSLEKDNPRLNALVNSTNGFDIAEADLKLRGAGDLIGVKQSGFTDCMKLISENPGFYNQISDLANEICSGDFII